MFLAVGLAERSTASPQRLFKVILVGNSSVGKTALLRRFCDGQFHSSTAATVGKLLSHSVCFQEMRSCILVDLFFFLKNGLPLSLVLIVVIIVYASF